MQLAGVNAFCGRLRDFFVTGDAISLPLAILREQWDEFRDSEGYTRPLQAALPLVDWPP
jgi:hypothetical protein